MLTYIVKRLLLAVVVGWAALTLMFLLVLAMPGDAVSASGGEKATGAAQANKREKYGLNSPAYVQYGRFFINLAQGDLGDSVKNNRSVNTDLKETVGNSLRLLFWGGMVQIGGSLILGLLAAARPRSFLDRITTIASVGAQAIPVFVTGLLFTYFLGGFPSRHGLSWLNFNVSSWPQEWQYLVFPKNTSWRSIVLPSVAVGIVQLALLARLLRSSMLEVMRADYLRTARAKGLPSWRVLMKHAFRNALIPYITAAGLALVEIFGIAVQTEFVFNIYGLGSRISEAAQIQDAPVILGLSSVVILAATIAALVVDLSYSTIDPRIRTEGGAK